MTIWLNSGWNFNLILGGLQGSFRSLLAIFLGRSYSEGGEQQLCFFGHCPNICLKSKGVLNNYQALLAKQPPHVFLRLPVLRLTLRLELLQPSRWETDVGFEPKWCQGTPRIMYTDQGGTCLQLHLLASPSHQLLRESPHRASSGTVAAHNPKGQGQTKPSYHN